MFGKKNPVKRAFRSDWYKKWRWLQYDEASDSALCFYCSKAEQEGKLLSTAKDLSYQGGLPIGRMPLKYLKSTKK